MGRSSPYPWSLGHLTFHLSLLSSSLSSFLLISIRWSLKEQASLAHMPEGEFSALKIQILPKYLSPTLSNLGIGRQIRKKAKPPHVVMAQV